MYINMYIHKYITLVLWLKGLIYTTLINGMSKMVTTVISLDMVHLYNIY